MYEFDFFSKLTYIYMHVYTYMHLYILLVICVYIYVCVWACVYLIFPSLLTRIISVHFHILNAIIIHKSPQQRPLQVAAPLVVVVVVCCIYLSSMLSELQSDNTLSADQHCHHTVTIPRFVSFSTIFSYIIFHGRSWYWCHSARLWKFNTVPIDFNCSLEG